MCCCTSKAVYSLWFPGSERRRQLMPCPLPAACESFEEACVDGSLCVNSSVPCCGPVCSECWEHSFTVTHMLDRFCNVNNSFMKQTVS